MTPAFMFTTGIENSAPRVDGRELADQIAERLLAGLAGAQIETIEVRAAQKHVTGDQAGCERRRLVWTRCLARE